MARGIRNYKMHIYVKLEQENNIDVNQAVE